MSEPTHVISFVDEDGDVHVVNVKEGTGGFWFSEDGVRWRVDEFGAVSSSCGAAWMIRGHSGLIRPFSKEVEEISDSNPEIATSSEKRIIGSLMLHVGGIEKRISEVVGKKLDSRFDGLSEDLDELKESIESIRSELRNQFVAIRGELDAISHRQRTEFKQKLQDFIDGVSE